MAADLANPVDPPSPTEMRVQVGAEPLHTEPEWQWLYGLGGGGVASFSGLVRDEQGQVEALHLEQYDPMTRPSLQRIAAEAVARWPLLGVSLLHRVGRVQPGELLVFVGVAAAHRAEAQAACEYVVDQIKTRAALWKKELRGGRWVWLRQKSADRRRQERWEA